jgi:hypothetical protein
MLTSGRFGNYHSHTTYRATVIAGLALARMQAVN